MSNVLNGTGNTVGKVKGSLQVAYGKKGEDGKSAYEIAIANGYEGTEAEWLDTLSGVYVGSGEMPEWSNVQIDPEGEPFPNYCEYAEYERVHDSNVAVVGSTVKVEDEYMIPLYWESHFRYDGILKPNTKYKIVSKPYFEVSKVVHNEWHYEPYIAFGTSDNMVIQPEDVELYRDTNLQYVEFTFTTPEVLEINAPIYVVFKDNTELTGMPRDLTIDVYEIGTIKHVVGVYTKEEVDEMLGNIIEALKGCSVSSAKIGEVTLTADGWDGEESPYSQVVSIEGVTENSQVDLKPSAEQLAIFHKKDLAFVTENDDGVVTIYAIGQKPQNDYTIQVTITETEGVITSG